MPVMLLQVTKSLPTCPTVTLIPVSACTLLLTQIGLPPLPVRVGIGILSLQQSNRHQHNSEPL